MLAAAVVLVGAAPASPPDYPANLIPVDDLRAALLRGERADLIDVRPWSQYAEQHIKGARSMPLRSVPARAREIARKGLVVFY